MSRFAGLAVLPVLALALVLSACADDAPDAPSTSTAGTAAEASADSASAPVPGAPAPAFTLTATDGTTHSLADFAGRTVVLEWLNYDCPFVGKHYGGGAMQALQTEAAADSVVWLSIVSSAPGEQGHFPPAEMDARTAEEGGRQMAVLMDPDGAVGRRYGALTTPHMFVIDADGRVVYNGAIDDRPSSDAASLDGARNYVREALAAVAAGRTPETTRTQPYGCNVKYVDA